MARGTTIVVTALVLLAGCSRSDKANQQIAPDPANAASASVTAASAQATTSAVVASSNPIASASVAPVNAPPPMPPLRVLGPNQTAAVVIRTKVKYPAKPVEWTRFIKTDLSAQSKKGSYLFIGEKLHRYQQREKVSANAPCPGETSNPFPKRILRNAEFVPDKKGKTMEVIGFHKDLPDQPNPTEIDHEIVALVPGYAFVKTSITDYGCGAHPLYGNKFELVAFGAEGTFEFVPESDYKDGSDVSEEKAIGLFNAQVDPAESEESLDGKLTSGSNVSVSMTYPAFTPRGSIWTVLYTAPSTWAGSYGGWAGYTRSVPVALDAAPARFRDAIVMPEVVATYIAAHEKDEDILGFTLGEMNEGKN